MRSGFFNPIVGYRMKSYNFIKRELYYIHFSGYFPKFLVQQFQNILMRTSEMEFRRVLKMFLLKRDSSRDYFFKILNMRLSPQKYLRWIPIPISNLQYF